MLYQITPNVGLDVGAGMRYLGDRGAVRNPANPQERSPHLDSESALDWRASFGVRFTF